MYVFGAILIYTVGTDPFIVYTSNIFSVLGLRAMYVLLAFTRLFGFALVLSSIFFFAIVA